MDTCIKACFHQSSCTDNIGFTAFQMDEAAKVHRFHRTLPDYQETSLWYLPGLAHELGISIMGIKDESTRFGLNSFKGLGGSYCIARCLADCFSIEPEELTFQKLQQCREQGLFSGLTAVTATDGNHGRGVAWAARQLGIACKVYMPKGSAAERVENIRREGAEVVVLDSNYDDSVRFAHRQAAKNGWLLLQDTTTDTDETVTIWLMQGYLTIAREIQHQWQTPAPTHILLQAGVGSMAGAMAACFTDMYKEDPPKIIVVESNQADCLYQTALANDGTLHTVPGDLATIMAGLACGEPCLVGWRLLDSCASCFLSVSDTVSMEGMRRLAEGTEKDPCIVSGECGAVTTGVIMELMKNPAYAAIKEKLQLNADSRILVISTEGATDKENYRRIVQKSSL